MPVDVEEIAKSLRQFVRTHNAQFQKLSGRKSQLLEIGALMIAAKHYELSGYDVELRNTRGKQLRVKLSTRGDPWNFSWFEARGKTGCFEIHANLPVADAQGTKGAKYVADVVVVPCGTFHTQSRLTNPSGKCSRTPSWSPSSRQRP